MKIHVLLFSLLLTVLLIPSQITFAATPEAGYQRIISLYSAHTENLVSLGASAQLIGISKSDTYPESIENIKRYTFREDPERFIAARPDLVLIRPMIERSAPSLVNKLKEAGIEVVSLQPTSVAGIYDYWRELGKLTGREENAEKMITYFKDELQHIESQVATVPENLRPRVYFESIHSKMKTFATSSIALFALRQAGGINVATDAIQVRNTNIGAYSKEHILSHAGDIDYYIAQHGRMNPITREDIVNESGFAAIKAVREDHIVLIQEELVSRPTLRLLDGIRELHAAIYPQPQEEQ